MEIIAEIGQNHNGDMALACELIAASAEAGADVAKFQIYDARRLFSKEGNPWYDYNCKTELSRDHVALLNEECNKYKIEFMASVFDTIRVEWLEAIGVKRYKVASRSINDQVLIERICKTQKPILISLGHYQGTEFPTIQSVGKIGYLYCVAQYPTSLEALNFPKIDFNKYIGFSDHTIGICAAQVALARGAQVIEKHFTIDKDLYGPDHAGSMTPVELCVLSQFRDSLKSITLR